MAEKNNTNISPPFYILPSNNTELQSFSQKFKLDMMEQIVSSIEFAIQHKLDFIEVFQFKNSDFVITVQEKDYLTNLDNVYSYYMEKEAYEFCPRVLALQKLLKNENKKS